MPKDQDYTRMTVEELAVILERRRSQTLDKQKQDSRKIAKDSSQSIPPGFDKNSWKEAINVLSAFIFIPYQNLISFPSNTKAIVCK